MKPNVPFVFAISSAPPQWDLHAKSRSSNLDTLGAHSPVFTTALSPLPVCMLYRGALVTGRAPLSLGMLLSEIPL